MDSELIPIYVENFKSYMNKSITQVIKKYDISMIQFKPIVLLNHYQEDGLSLRDLTEKIGIDKANVTRVINSLLDEEIVYKSDDKLRGYKLKLTEKGLEIANEMLKERDKTTQIIFKGFEDNEKEQFFKLLKKMCESLKEEL